MSQGGPAFLAEPISYSLDYPTNFSPVGLSALAELTQKFRSVWPLLDERTRRLMAANEAIGLGYGGVSLCVAPAGFRAKPSQRASAK